MREAEQLVKFAKKLKAEKLVCDGVNKGSISLRKSDGTILMSPSKLSYDELDIQKINMVDIDGNFISQPAPVSRDMYFHLEIYQKRQDVHAIIHTHSVYATALSLAGKKIPFILYGMKFHCRGEVDIAPFELPNTPECNEGIICHLKKHNAVLLENQGLVCVGETMQDCYETTEFVEHLSKSYLHALQIGSVKEIIEEERGYGNL